MPSSLPCREFFPANPGAVAHSCLEPVEHVPHLLVGLRDCVSVAQSVPPPGGLTPSAGPAEPWGPRLAREHCSEVSARS